jgi:hypothetical protein
MQHRHGSVVGTLRAHCCQRAQQRFGEHDHAWPATIGAVVDAPVGIVGMLAQRPEPQLDLP